MLYLYSVCHNMDVLKPDLIWIDGRCYRKNPLKVSSNARTDEEFDSFANNLSYLHDNFDEEAVDIEKTECGYRVTLDIANVYLGHILGKKGDTKRRIENETNTYIKIPKIGENKPVIISGAVKSAVISAKVRIEVIIDSARQRQPFTHFLSFPLNSQKIKENFFEFKEDILRNYETDRGIDESLFQNPNKLHLTIGTLVLLTEKERIRASEILSACHKEIVEPILKNMPLVVEIQGLEYMNDDPAEVDVLYAKVNTSDGSNVLQILSDHLLDKFVQAGIMQKQYERVKIHSTVMNTTFRKENVEDSISHEFSWSNQREKQSFDARNILKLFKDFDFGKHRIESIHLSQRYSTAVDTGYYNCTASLPMP